MKLRKLSDTSERESREHVTSYLQSEFLRIDLDLDGFECVDQPQETCDREIAELTNQKSRLCELMHVDERTMDGFASATSISFEKHMLERSEVFDCIADIENLDRVARKATVRPLLWGGTAKPQLIAQRTSRSSTTLSTNQ